MSTNQFLGSENIGPRSYFPGNADMRQTQVMLDGIMRFAKKGGNL